MMTPAASVHRVLPRVHRLVSRRPALLAAATAAALLSGACALSPAPLPAHLQPEPVSRESALAQRVEIRRTAHGVPHILAGDLRAGAFGLAWVQLEDHGARIIEGMNAARGRAALVAGASRIDADAAARLAHSRAALAFDSLHPDAREVYAGFAAGMNHFIRLHQDVLPAWMEPDFTAADVLARDITRPSEAVADRFRRRMQASRPAEDADMPPDVPEALLQEGDNVGSNAWALAPSRTTSGRAILLRNPHLSWTAGYYEAHLRVPGKLDFYGDFRIGGPFTVIGGFNRDLGFSTTNNASRSHEIYALTADARDSTRYIIDGAPVALTRHDVRVEYRDRDGRTATAERSSWSTRFGPVIHRDSTHIYILRTAAHNDFRAGEQWLRMMQATSLDEWKDAMRIGARTTSNFTYADRAGNIFYVWMSGAPLLSHEPGGDSIAVPASSSSVIWSRRAPFDSLPQLLNPRGGYVRNENDSPHYANMNEVMGDSFPFEVEPRRLRLRSQHAIELLHNDRIFSLTDVVDTKHSMRMLLADRVKTDLLAALAAADSAGSADSAISADSAAARQVAEAVTLLRAWDNTAAAGSRGSVLFETWWDRYRDLAQDGRLYQVEWDERAPLSTPRGLADAGAAVRAFEWAIAETTRRFGGWDVAWGNVHRVRRGDVDVPVGGCGGDLGCFRVLNFATAADGRRVVNGGDGWVLAVEFGDEPRAFSILAYGQSPDPQSPYHDDQAAMFAASTMKRVHWTEADIERETVRRYRPGRHAQEDR